MKLDIDATYRRYGPMVLRRCRRLLDDEESAVDALQDVFVRLLRYQDRIEDRHLSALLFRMATNVCLNRIRSQRRAPTEGRDDVIARIATVADPTERSLARATLTRLFGGQKVDTRTMAVLHLVDGMTLKETARELNMSVSNVRKRLRALRSALGELETP